ncbi:cupin domain-containing protein [Labrys wisconsinensis]|uniref:Quercetin dioxygenase-like cupin family protein n=1 Tax=Labrys wisconsinensis TaxID=425677 RepID=A0ABU0JIU1_9HYPH|nr:cupin domain-containing protein [Labrys wisconsinensis]MDQ0473189.1 quercetin dioxygenase-like cupin family protein [Labrys wisconsinensis]
MDIEASADPALAGPAERPAGSIGIERTLQAPSRARDARMTFEPGSRTGWQAHPVGQTLIVTAGSGRVQRWAAPVEAVQPGDALWIAPGERHWLGAAAGEAVTFAVVRRRRDTGAEMDGGDEAAAQAA